MRRANCPCYIASRQRLSKGKADVATERTLLQQHAHVWPLRFQEPSTSVMRPAVSSARAKPGRSPTCTTIRMRYITKCVICHNNNTMQLLVIETCCYDPGPAALISQPPKTVKRNGHACKTPKAVKRNEHAKRQRLLSSSTAVTMNGHTAQTA